MVLLLVVLGALLFYWTRKLLGTGAAFFALLLFVFSPDFLAHGTLVTTDVAAALGVTIALYWFLQFLYVPLWKNAVIAGIVLALALLVKFSTFILLPIFGILFGLYLQLRPRSQPMSQQLFLYLKSGVIMLVVAVVLLGVVYQLHILNYPAERQLSDSKEILGTYYGIPPEDIQFSIASFSLLRPYAHYVLGLLRSTQRIQMQSMDYFLGETGPTGWPYYFPVLYATKIPLAFHIFSIGAIAGLVLAYIKRNETLRAWLFERFSFIAMGIFVVVYSAIALGSAIQIGFRHLLPLMPFLYILVAAGIRSLAVHTRYSSLEKIALVALLGWHSVSSLAAFPYYLSYYNELGGGLESGYKIAGHSNYDWGQDAKRLAQWMEKENVKKIYVDFFGRGDLKYYLGTRYVPWYGSSWWELHGIERDLPEEFPRGNYLAVSATFLTSGGWANEDRSRIRDYTWLDSYKPVGRAGTSVFLYYIDE
jgi:4-amino-4-deoxy-L-arabinose transferase-like glycosyltransferase